MIIQWNDNELWLGPLQEVRLREPVNDADLTATFAYYAQGKAITGATNVTPIVVTSANHGLSNGDKIVIVDVLGNIAANCTATVANKTTNTFELSGVAGSGAYTSGGIWYPCVPGVEEVPMDYQANSDGQYFAVIPGTISFKALEQYLVVVRASNYELEFRMVDVARPRMVNVF